ncbi:MAG: autotransporter outer membrane beta-barrel domain-containing protein [Rickettsiales bacterium]|nr:autotransporter outer membrane beta-barrel domain-containing protein [Rickettsiales bacterium]
MSSFCKQVLIALVIPTLIIVGVNGIVFGAGVNPQIANISYWYDDADIRGVIKSRLGDSVYIAPAVPNNAELIRDVAAAALLEAQAGKPALIPVNLNNSHWTGIAIRTKLDGNIIVFYNDSFGTPVGGEGSQSGRYIEAIKKILPTAEIVDLRVHQQNDGSSCGAFTAENLIALAGLNQVNLTPEAARELLAKINDARTIRILQLGSLEAKIITAAEIIAGSMAGKYAEAVSGVAFSDMANFVGATMDRLTHLYLIDSGNMGVSSGDGESDYGLWIKGSYGSGIFKPQASLQVKQKSTGGSIGFDGKMDDDTVIGIALNHNQTKLKPKSGPETVINNISNNTGSKFSGDIRSLIGSLYGSINMSERLVLSGEARLGQVDAKMNYQSLLNGNSRFKLKGELLGGSLTADYYSPIGKLFLVPNLGVSYETVRFKGKNQGNLKIGKLIIRRPAITGGIALTGVFEIGECQLVPEIRAGYEAGFSVKSNRLKISNSSGMTLSDYRIPVPKDTYRLGASMGISFSRFEASAGYEQARYKRYLGDSFYGKLRINI